MKAFFYEIFVEVVSEIIITILTDLLAIELLHI